MQTDFILTCVAHDKQAVGDGGDKLFRSSLKHTQLRINVSLMATPHERLHSVGTTRLEFRPPLLAWELLTEALKSSSVITVMLNYGCLKMR